MLKEIQTYLTFGNRFFSLEISEVGDKEIYNGLELTKKKNSIDISGRYEIDSPDEISELIKKDTPVVLTVNNNKVITKMVQGSASESEKLILKAFPNLNLDEFYVDILSQNSIHFVSICRKDYLDDLIARLIKDNVSVVYFALGLGGIKTLIPYLDNEVINTSNAELSIINKEIVSITKTKTNTSSTYKVNGLELKSKELLGFANSLEFISRLSGNSFNSDKRLKLVNEFKQKQFFNQFLKIGLISLFIVLLINFLIFNNYHGKLGELSAQSQVLNTSKSKLTLLKDQVQNAEKLVNDLLKSDASKSSFYINDIVTQLPESFLLSKINYQPLLKKIKTNKPIENDLNVIVARGNTSHANTFSNWVTQLEALDWISRVEIISFEDLDASKSEFEIKIFINDESEAEK